VRVPRVRFTVRRLMVAVALCGLAFFLVSRPIMVLGLVPNLIHTPGEGVLEFVSRILTFGFGPLLGVIWQRTSGGRGIIGGLVGGAVIYGGYILLATYLSPRSNPFSFGLAGDFLVFCFVGAANGLTLGVAAWGLTAFPCRLLSKCGTSDL